MHEIWTTWVQIEIKFEIKISRCQRHSPRENRQHQKTFPNRTDQIFNCKKILVLNSVFSKTFSSASSARWKQRPNASSPFSNTLEKPCGKNVEHENAPRPFIFAHSRTLVITLRTTLQAGLLRHVPSKSVYGSAMFQPAVHGLGRMAVTASIPTSCFLLLAAFELEDLLPLPTPLDAPAIAAGTVNVLECVDVVQAKLAVTRVRDARRFPWPALRHPLRPGARKLASTDDAPLRRFDVEESFGALA